MLKNFPRGLFSLSAFFYFYTHTLTHIHIGTLGTTELIIGKRQTLVRTDVVKPSTKPPPVKV